MRLNYKSPYLERKKATKAGQKRDATYGPILKDYYDTGMELRSPFEQYWIITMAFIMGKQYSFFNRSAHTLQQVHRVKGRIRNVDNKLLPKWKRQISDLIKNPPEASVVPNSYDDEDIKAAKIGDKLLKSFYRSAKMRKKIRQLAGWMFSTGNGFLDDRWNKKLGPVVFNDQTGELEYQGDVDVDVWSPLEILVPFVAMGTVELHDFPWLIKHKWRPLDWITANYDRGAEVVHEEMTKPVVDISIIMGAPTGTKSETKGAVVCDCYIQPNRVYPNGLFLTGANGTILNKKDFPYTNYFLEHFKDLDMPGVFWGKSTSSEAIGLQKIWNRTLSGLDEYNRTMAKGKGLIPRGANLEKTPDDTHGEWLSYTPILGLKPELMTLKTLPPTYDKILALTNVSMEDLYSQHEVSRGTNKSDIRSGEMLDILREQDSHGNIPAHAVFEESYEAVMSRVLKRIQFGYKEERMIKVTGKEGEFDIFAFKGADLRNNTDVSVKRQSSLPESRVARETQILSRFEKGLYGDPTDPEVRRHVMNMLDDAVVKDIYSDTKLDEAYSRWENKLLQSDEADVYLINDYDNHQIHVREHNHYRKSMEYQKVRVMKPQVFQQVEMKFTQHIQLHQKFIQDAMEAQIKQQIAIQKATKGGGK